MEYVLDERGERVPLIDPETGRQKTDKRGRRQWKRTSVSLNPLDRKAKLKALRESWAKTCNARGWTRPRESTTGASRTRAATSNPPSTRATRPGPSNGPGASARGARPTVRSGAATAC
nr:hypothetical protein [Bifidobacterium longum]